MRVENEQVEVDFAKGNEQVADSLTKALAGIKFLEMRSLLGVQELPSIQKFKGKLLANYPSSIVA